MKSWLEISAQRLSANYALLARAAAPNTALLAVIKANAYGHGAALCAPILARAGAPWLGVTDAAEGELVLRSLAAAEGEPAAAALSSFAPAPKILIMSGFLPEDAATIVRSGLTPVVWHRDHLDWLIAAAQYSAAPIRIHLEIDTGMSRQGIAPGAELNTLLAFLKSRTQLQLDGVFTHFASAEIANSPQTRIQRSRFEQAIAAVGQSGLHPAWVHAGNSSTCDTEPTEQTLPWLRTLAASLGARSMVRTGLALYGYCLPLESASAASPTPQPALQPSLLPVLTWKTRILGLRDLAPGDTVGYNGIFRAPGPMRVALLPIGYANGLRRELSASNAQPGGWAIVHGQRAPIAGRISMNLTTLDVTHILNVSVGDEVTLLGEGITADDHARLARTIPYEILCGLRVLPDGPAAHGAVTS